MVLPFLVLGIPSGHDFEFHVNSWMEVLRQWKLGIFYPRWAALAHFGYGEARFIFYPPFSWTLGALLGAVLPWLLVPGAYVWIALTLSGCSMFLLARSWLPRRDAIFAAALYAANPYYLVIVYWRSAFAELLAGALLPLLLLWALRLEHDGRRAALPLALVVAAAWLTNAPAAVLLTYSLVLLAGTLAIIRRSPQILLWSGLALLLGFGLAAFYVLPAAYEQRWVEIAQVLSPGVQPQDNFLFTTLNDADHNRFNLLVSLVAAAEMAVLTGAIWLSRGSWVHARPAWWMITAWATVCSLLMFPFSFFLYRVLPELRFVQLPWRWLLCLNVAFALFAAVAWRHWVMRGLVCIVMLGVLAFAWHRVQPPWWDTRADLAEMQANQQRGVGYEGTDEYAPIGADPYEIKRDARRATFQGEGAARIVVLEWAAESRSFSANVGSAGTLVLRLFNYPAWRVEVNGSRVEPQTQEVTGQMTVPVERGENEVRLTFARTRDRTLGGVVSLVTLLMILAASLQQWHSGRFDPGEH